MTSLDPMRKALTVIGQRPEAVLGAGTAHVVAHGLEIVDAHALPGVELRAVRSGERIVAEVVVTPQYAGGSPIHLCFGMFEPHGRQRIDLTLTVRAGASATVWSHCLFEEARDALHAMEGRIAIEDGATLMYQEAHYHGPAGGVRVVPRAAVTVGRGARYRADFALVRGRVGELDIDYTVDVGEDGLAELTSKVFGYGDDRIRMREVVRLNGANARGLVKTRIAAQDDATAEIRGAMFGNAPGARGHVDCTEIVRDRAVVSAVPEVRVTNPLAKVTHEAAIGSVDSRQLETLMARGLDPDAAVDLIIRGMLA